MSPTAPATPDPTAFAGPPFGRPALPPTLGERYDQFRTRFALAPTRVVLVVAVLAAGALGWWLLRPPPPAVEQTLPFASTTVAGAATSSSGATSGGSTAGGSSPAGAAVPGAADPSAVVTTPAQLVVHGAGAVRVPGVYRLPAGSRVDDLVSAAGGLAPDADPARLNLAAPLTDGERVYVPHVGELEVPAAVTGAGSGPASSGTGGSTPSGGSSGSAVGSSGGSAPAAPVNLNTATLQELDTLPGVGPSTAQAILDYRQQHGRFGTVDELLEVRGIGDAKLAQLRDRVTL